MVAKVASLFMSPIRMNNNVVIDMAINALTGTLLGPLCKGKKIVVHYLKLRVVLPLLQRILPESKKQTVGALTDLEKGPFLRGGIASKNIEFHDNPQNIRHWDYDDEGYKSPTDVNDIILECIDDI